MRKFTFIIVICLVTIVCQAQEHLTFMDIPFNGSLEDFCSKLIKEKGFSASSMTDGEQYLNMETKKLIGNFYGVNNCTLYIRKHDRLDNISSVIVEDTLFTLSDVDINRIISLHDEKYGKHSCDSAQNYVWYTWETASGDVELSVQEDRFKLYYTDYTERDIRKTILEEYEKKKERQTIREICGIPFGSSYEIAEEILENKYGSSSIFSDKRTILYTNINYAGISFDKIMFLFQSDGYKSYLNGCIFVIETSSLKQAKEKRDMLYRKMCLKYDIMSGVDDDGNEYYWGGHSPVPFDGFGFSIDILKYKNERNAYAARLMYGRYNYVKEEF